MAIGKAIMSAVKKAGMKAAENEKPRTINNGSSIMAAVRTARPSSAPIRGRSGRTIGGAIEEAIKKRGMRMMKKGGAVKKAASKKK